MIVNFLFQVLLFFVCIVLAHACWNYMQNNLLKKPVDIVTSTQIEKYEKIIEELQQSQQPQQSQQSQQSQQPSLDPSISDSSTPPNILVNPLEQELDQFVDTLL